MACGKFGEMVINRLFLRKKVVISLAMSLKTCIVSLVPPYDSFGDWATPRQPAAELFYPFTSAVSADFPPFLSESKAISYRSTARQASSVSQRNASPKTHWAELIHRYVRCAVE